MNDQNASEQPDDLWIEVPISGQPGNSAKFFALTSEVYFPYGHTGITAVRTKFNLSAYVRSEVAIALNRRESRFGP